MEPVRVLQERGVNPAIFYENGNIHPAAEYARRLATLREWAASDDPAIVAPIPVVEGAYDPAAWEQVSGAIGDRAIDQARELIARAEGGNAAGADGPAGPSGTATRPYKRKDEGGGSLPEPRGLTDEEALRVAAYREAIEGGADPEAAVTLAVDPALRETRCRLCYRARLEAAAAYAAENGFTAIGTTLSVSPYQYTEVIREEVERAAAKAGLAPCFEDYRPFYDEATRRSRARGMYRQNNCGCRISDLEAQAERAQRKARRARAKAAEAEAHAEERAAAEAERQAKRAERRAYNEKQARKRAILKAMREQRE